MTVAACPYYFALRIVGGTAMTFGALTGLSALAALFLGVLLAD